MQIAKAAAKLPNSLRRFGFVSGARLLLQIERELPKRSNCARGYRLPDFPAPIRLRDQISDHAMFWQCIVDEQYDIRRFPQTRRLLDDLRGQADQATPLLLDCGANIGMASAWFANNFLKLEIVAVEPDAENFEVLKANTAMFGPRVRCVRGAVWHESTWLSILNPDAGSAAFRVGEASAAAPDSVRAYTVPELAALAGRDRPTIVKLDIEGAQKYLFTENCDWVGDCHLIMLELDDWLMPWEGTSQPFFRAVSQYPFEYLMRGEVLFCFRDFRR